MEPQILSDWLFADSNRIRLSAVDRYYSDGTYTVLMLGLVTVRLQSTSIVYLLDDYYSKVQPQTRAASRAKRGEQGEASKATNDSVRV